MSEKDLSIQTPEATKFGYIKAKVPIGLKLALDEQFAEAVKNGTHEFKGDFFGDMVTKMSEKPEQEIKEVEVVKEVEKVGKNGNNTWLIAGVIVLAIIVIALVITLIVKSRNANRLKVELEDLKSSLAD